MSENELPGANGSHPDKRLPGPFGLLRAAPTVARFGAVTARNITQWGVETSLQFSIRVARAAVALQASRPPAERPAVSPAQARVTSRTAGATPASLRARGAELLRLSADVGFAAQVHPAYARILDELAPDEARIIRLLAAEGPQAIVDVRTGRPIGSQLVERGLTMIGTLAGCAHLDRVPAYLDNLARLGMLRISPEPLPDALRYQVLEVQPDVMAARKRGGHGRTVRRSIHLTTFGGDFCDMCLPVDGGRAGTAPLPTPGTNGSHA